MIYIIFVIILVGVTAALYQVYDVNHNINVGNEKKLSRADKARLAELSAKAKTSSNEHSEAEFDQAAAAVFGPGITRKMALTAFNDEEEGRYAIPLLRRREKLVYNGDVKVKHLSFWVTKLPKFDVRGLLITLVIINCFLAQLLGGMSIYTIHYKFSASALLWINEPFYLMIIIYVLIFMTFCISRFDMYMNDIYQIGKLSRHVKSSEGGVSV